MTHDLSHYQILQQEFDAEDGSFLIQLRCDFYWDKSAFTRLTQNMYEVAKDLENQPNIPKWVANGFWYVEKFTKEWTNHPNFPSPDQEYHEDCLELLYFLCDYLFENGVGLVEGALENWVYYDNPRLSQVQN